MENQSNESFENPTFNAHTLVSNGRNINLTNTWGIVVARESLWITDNGSGYLSNYDFKGNQKIADIVLQSPDKSGNLPAPTGIVENYTCGFVVGGRPSFLLMASENGVIYSYNPQINPTIANIIIDNSNTNVLIAPVYKGLAISCGNLYVTDFHNNKIDVFDPNFNQLSGYTFQDPNLPLGFAPFNIYNIDDNLYVLYALQKPGAHDDQAGAGNGYINIFNSGGKLLKRFVSGGVLNSPWGITRAPKKFCYPKGTLLVGNFGDGRINAFDCKGCLVGNIRDCNLNSISIDGLWGIAIHNKCSKHLFFASGPDDESNGLVGSIQHSNCKENCGCEKNVKRNAKKIVNQFAVRIKNAIAKRNIASKLNF